MRRAGAAAAALLAAAACGEPGAGPAAGGACPADPGGPTPTVRHGAPGDWPADVGVWRTRRAGVPGAAGPGADSAAALDRVVDVARAGGGRLLVADAGRGRVVLFGPDGRAVRAMGGDSVDFVGLREVARGPGDTVRAFDARRWREFRFDAAGRPVGAGSPPRRPDFAGTPDLAYDGRGVLYHVGYGGFASSLQEALGDRERGVARGEVDLARWSRPDTAWRTVATVPSVEVFSSETGLQGAPFARQPLWDPGPDGSVWYADSGEYRLTRFSAGGDTLCRIRVDVEAPAVTAEDREAYLGAEDADLPFAQRMWLRRIRGRMPLPERRPALTRILAAESGGVWVRPAPEAWAARPDTVTWHVFAPTGSVRARVRIPGDVRPEVVGPDAVTGIRRGEAGGDRVVRLEVVEAEPGAGGG